MNNNNTKKPIGSSNVFALSTSQTQRQDRSYYKSYYTFNANVELAEYTLPILSQQITSKGGKGGRSQGKKLPPIQEQQDSAPGLQGMEMDMEGAGSQGIEYDENGNPIDHQSAMAQQMMEYDDEEDYGEEMEGNGDEDALGYEDFRNIIMTEGPQNNQSLELRKANFIRKGTAIWNMQNDIQTGEQAISFFAKHGVNIPIKFLNCNRRPVPFGEFRPYDLVVELDEKKLKNEYFTVSAQGVVQVFQERRGVSEKATRTKLLNSPAEFFALSDWMQQVTLFNVLTSMKFFKLYLVQKVFSSWKGNVRHRTFRKTRQELAKNLIQARPDFQPSFIEVKKILYDMQVKLTFNLCKQQVNFEIAAYLEDQKNHRELMKSAYNNQVADIIENKLTRLIKCIADSTTVSEQDDLDSAKMGQAAKHKSMVLLKEEMKLKQRVNFLATRNKTNLGTFIRLVDYMVVETQVLINQESADKIIEEMNNEAKKYYIQTVVQFDNSTDEGISFNPTKQQFHNEFEQLLSEMSAVTAEVQRVTNNQDFHSHMHGLHQEKGPSYKSIVEGSFRYKGTKESIIQRLKDDFEYIEDKSKSFQQCQDVSKFCDQFNFEDFEREHSDLDSIREMFDQCQSYENKINKHIKTAEHAGLIHASGRTLKTKLTDKVVKTQGQLRKYLFTLAEQTARDINNNLTNIKSTLGKNPTNLKDYVDYCRQLQESQAKSDQMEIQKKKLEDMKQVLGKYREKSDSGVSAGQSQIQLLQGKIEAITADLISVRSVIQTAVSKSKEGTETNTEQLTSQIQQETDKLDDLLEKIESDTLMSKHTAFRDALDELGKHKKKYDACMEKINMYQEYETTLGTAKSNINQIDKFQAKYDLRMTIWTNRMNFFDLKQKWYYEPFAQQDASDIEKQVQTYKRETQEMTLTKKGEDEVLDELSKEVTGVFGHLKLIVALGQKAMEKRHWKKIFDLTEGMSSMSNNLEQTCTFDYLIKDGNIEAHTEDIEDISGMAQGELAIRTQMQSVGQMWEDMMFSITPYRDSKDRFILGDIEDLMTQLEDDQMQVSTMMGSKFVAEIRDMVEEWEKKLGYIQAIIDEWLTFQRQWMYLENIFNAEDIQKQLPGESVLFKAVDKFWKEFMGKAKKDSHAVAVVDSGGNLKKFIENNKKLEDIQKALEDYLGTKRAAFPRFYFLSNDELLEILSQTRNVQAVQPHLSKCFDNMKKVQFSEEKNSKEVLGMWSSELEYVKFSQQVMAIGAVEFWLTKIEYQMTQSLYDCTKTALYAYPVDGTQRDQWLFTTAAQAILTIDMLKWTEGVEQHIRMIMKGEDSNALKVFLDFSQRQLNAMINLVRSPLEMLQRTAMGALIVLDVHARTVVQNMIKARVEHINDFEWSSQLRYYWEELTDRDGEPFTGDDCSCDVFARQTNTRFRYGYEYLGNGPRLVITPLTDQCYMTLTGALHLNFGGNPAGPAGTGKTETTKDLAKALAVQCVVFNCSDGLDFRMMGRFFTGLASGGAWSCFDEFNRIDIEVLSVIAQQILTIQSAVRARLKEFDFEGKVIPLNLRFGVFITMNPGYAGRTELPDNLKALFRPMAMMIPDYRLIAEIILYSEGFGTAELLSKKMVKLYSLSSEQLSKQDHYDFGMRAVKSVLVMAGKLRRKDDTVPEDILLIRAMRDSNVPKFLEQDLPLFKGIVEDLFPGVVVPRVDYGKLKEEILAQMRNLKLQIEMEGFIEKIIQLLDSMTVRHGNMLVGTTGTGKTTISIVLSNALSSLCAQGDTSDTFYKPVHIDTLNPKSVTMGELYGEVNKFTNEWTEGIVSDLVKKAVVAAEGKEADHKRWILFDGPVDALWIENMNTVLDDNKMLCLNNGQRIKMPDTCTMMFEVNDLGAASPATVSRCGMVYLEPLHLGWECLIRTWKEKMESIIVEPYLTKVCNILLKMFEKLLIVLRTTTIREKVPSQDSNLVQSCLKFLEIFLSKEVINLENREKIADPENTVMTYLAFSVIWSLGANVVDDQRPLFGEYFRNQMSMHMPDFPKGDVFDFGISKDHKLEAWNEQLPKFEFDPKENFFNILVPTNDTVKFKYLLSTLVYNECNVLLTGETGVGKSVIIKDFLMKSEENIVSAFVNFSGKTSCNNLKDAFEGNLEAKRKTLLGPPAGKRMVFFIDDVNMPQLEKYGAQPPNELLRQTIDQGGFYDTKTLKFKQVTMTTFVLACGPPEGGRSAVSPRLFRHFNMIWVPNLSQQSMKQIFSSILKGYLEGKERGGLATFADGIIKCAVEVYQNTINTFLPTPSKCHYTFNLRDLSKVIQGMLMCNNEDIEDKEYLVYLYINETYRVFRDRLIDEKDRDKFSELAHGILEKYMTMDWELSEYKNVLYGDFETPERKYIKLSATMDLIPCLEQQLGLYNTDNRPMNLVFFEDCIMHLAKIARILRQERGNAMIVGVGGSGRSSMARLGASINRMSTYSIEITKNYREKEWHENIKELLRSAGVEDQKTQFLFSDTQIVHESFLEDINNLLNSGEIPNLFPREEKDSILEDIAEKAKTAGQDQNKDTKYAFFVAQCRERLHLVLTFSPVGQAFRDRCRQFPSIINCCTIDWYNAWPSEALFSVASRQYEDVAARLNIKEHVETLANTSVFLHQAVKDASEDYFNEQRRRNYTTPTSYLDLIKTYIEMLGAQQAIVPVKMATYQNGLQRLSETNEMVADLKTKLIKLMPEIEEKSTATQEMVKDLEVQSKDAAEIEKTTAVEEAASKKIYNAVMLIKTDCEGILAEAMPALQKALAALDTLQKKDIDEMKSYAKPPDDLVLVLDGVALLLGEKAGWESTKAMMSNPNAFIAKLQNYDKEKITDGLHKKIKKFTNNPIFKPELIKKKSSAGESLCMFVCAMDKYTEVSKIVAPKKVALAQAEKELEVAQNDLKGKQAALQLVRNKIHALQNNYKMSQQTLEELNKQKETTEVQLGRAEKLVNGLADEAVRWGESIVLLEKELVNMMGNTVLAAGFISYVGTFTQDYRQALLKKWMNYMTEKNVAYQPTFSLTDNLGDPVLIREWGIKGLPADALSVENGIMTTTTKRWPLMIDPQSQANKWIKNMEKVNNLQAIKLSNPKLSVIITTAIKLGKPIMLENIEEMLDPQLEPLLQKSIVKYNGVPSIKMGDEYIMYNQEFKFFMTTKLPNPHYMPEICIKVCLINFTVTPGGLEEQLLVEVVKCEQPEVELQKDQLIVQLADCMRQLLDLETKILKLLVEASDDILNDEELILTLEQSKETSVNIKQRMEEAEETSKVITATRESYRPVANRGSILYFVIADLANIDPMYQYSLDFFSKLFVNRLQQAEKNDDLEKRLAILIEDETRSFYFSICRGLFERHKLLYSFLNASSILRTKNDINIDEWNFFLRGSPTDFRKVENPIDYVNKECHEGILGLEEAHVNFRDLIKSFSDPTDKISWKDLMTKEDPHLVDLPAIYEDRLSNFQKLMLIKVCRPSKLIYGVKKFVKGELGAVYIESPAFDLEGTLTDSTCITPIIFVLSAGADPIAYLTALAVNKGMKEKFKAISLGQGQGVIAQRIIQEGQAAGNWVCLQNCHLSASWMPELERIQEMMDPSMIHAEYRLWLTSMPSPVFPVPVLQGGLKLTNEPPKGLKANMHRSLTDIGEERYESNTKGREYKKLLFALAYFHAAILERRKYGAIGWNIPYEWMNSDFKTSELNLFMYLEEQPEVPYQALNYIVARVCYGGRVTDDKDVVCISAMLKKYFTAEIMNDNYKLSKLETYYAPPEGTFTDMLGYISTLPLDEDPEVFGLHPNANIAFEVKTVNEFMDTILIIQPRAAGGAAARTPEEIVTDMAKDFTDLLPKQLDTTKASAETFAFTEKGAMNSLGVFFGQELERFNDLLKVMGKSLDNLIKAISGTVVMSMDLELMFNKFIDAKVPDNWIKFAYPCLKPLASWFKDLQKRVEFMTDWLVNGPPKSFWVPAFFFPQGFMTASAQMYARHTNQAIDTLAFKTNVQPFLLEGVTEAPETGMQCHGFYIQGARWDDRKMCVEDSHIGVPICPFPVIWLEPVLDVTLDTSKNFHCPMYKTSVRQGELSTTGHSTNFVMFMHLPTEKHSDFWTRRGAALLCMTDD